MHGGKNEDASKAKLCTRLSMKGLDKREAKFASTNRGKLLSDVGEAAEVFLLSSDERRDRKGSV